MTGLNTDAVLDGIVSNALQLGLFDRVNTHEPKAPPGAGITGAVWVDTIRPYAGGSGLNTTSAVIVFNFRIYQGMLKEPQDLIDPTVIKIVDILFAQYSGDFDLGGSAREVDLLGETGTPLSGQAGYVTIDQKIYRIFDVYLPVIVNDVWSQSA